MRSATASRNAQAGAAPTRRSERTLSDTEKWRDATCATNWAALRYMGFESGRPAGAISTIFRMRSGHKPAARVHRAPPIE